MINVAERSDVKLLEKNARIYAAQNAEVMKGIMSNPFGRAWMYDLLEACHIGHSPFNTDIAVMSFSCGEQNIGLRLWGQLQTICPENYTLMMQEHNERDISNAALAERTRSENSNGGIEAADAGSGDADYQVYPGDD